MRANHHPQVARRRLALTSGGLCLGFLATLLGASCGGGTDDSTREPGDPADASADADAELLRACARKAIVQATGVFDSDPPQHEAQRSYFERACVADATAPGSTISVEHIDRCSAALAARNPCLRHPPIECVPPAGTRSIGARCKSDHQCASGACQGTGGGGCGVCIERPKVGDSCVEPYTRSCGLGLACEPLSRSICLEAGRIAATARCAEPARETELVAETGARGGFGDACVTDYTCKVGLRCVSGLCQGLTRGDACVSDGITCAINLVCGPGLHCDCTSRTCIDGDLPPVCGAVVRQDGSESWCRAGSAPSCAPCRVVPLGGSCGRGGGSNGESLPTDPVCDRAAICDGVQCGRAGCGGGTCRVIDPYGCSRL